MKELFDLSTKKQAQPLKKHRNQSLSKTERLVILALAVLAVGVLVVFCVVLILNRVDASKPASENEDYVWVLPQKSRDKTADGGTASDIGTGFVLDGVMLSEKGGSVAVISSGDMSHIVGIGEEIDGWQLVSIDDASATLRSSSSEMTLTLKNEASE